MLMRQVLADAAWVRPHAVAVRDADASITYGELDDRVHRLATALNARGNLVGERVALMSENSFRYYEFYFGCCESGAVAVTVNIRWTAAEISAYFQTVRPRAVLADVSLRELILDVLRSCDSIVQVLWFDSDAGPGQPLEVLPETGAVVGEDYETVLAFTRPAALPPVDPDAPSIIASTSGTTGSYRGAVISQRATWAAGLGWIAKLGFTEAERAIIPLPLYFAGGSPNWTLTFFVGGQVTVMRKYSLKSFLLTATEQGITFAMLVPTMIYDIADHDIAVVEPALATLRYIGTGGAPISAERVARAIEVLGPRFVITYGLTEACAAGTVLTPPDYTGGAAGVDVELLRTVGRPWPGVGLRVWDAEGIDVPHDGTTQGEIVCLGPSIAAGYFGAPGENDTFRDGVVYTGDLAVVLPNGCIRVVERKKDLIISGGINVVPREVEEVIAADPRVQAVAVTGAPHRRYGECVCAFVVTQPGQQLTEADVLEWCSDRLASYKRPKAVVFIDKLPVNSTGKVVKRALASLVPTDELVG